MARYRSMVLKGACPRCGASRSKQKWRVRHSMGAAGTSVYDMNPVNGVVCPHCGLPFRASILDADEGILVSDDEMELAPSFCPRCGSPIHEVRKGSLAANLMRAINERGMTQQDLARKAGVSECSVSRITRDLVTPTPVMLSKLAKAVGVEAEELLGND